MPLGLAVAPCVAADECSCILNVVGADVAEGGGEGKGKGILSASSSSSSWPETRSTENRT